MATILSGLGYDVVHVRDLGLASADDRTILAAAASDRRTVISRDADFAMLLALGGASMPSFVHLRVVGLNRPETQADLLVHVLELTADDLEAGAIVTVRGDKVRIRRLPVLSR